MGKAVWRVTIKPKNRSIFRHVGFRPEKNVCLPTQLGACSHPTGRSTVPYWEYWCRIDVRTPWACHGVPTGPPGPRRAPTAARRLRPADFHRRPPVWAARNSYRRRPGILFPFLFTIVVDTHSGSNQLLCLFACACDLRYCLEGVEWVGGHCLKRPAFLPVWT